MKSTSRGVHHGLIAVICWISGCGAAPQPTPDGASYDAASDAAQRIDSASDAATEASAAPDDCLIQRVTTASQCSESCGARLTLPDNSRYCTQPCTTDAYCQSYSPTLKCAMEAGACMERCSTDAECVRIGLPRCHPVGMFCDTLPPCMNNQQCVGYGLTRCVMPGAYCE